MGLNFAPGESNVYEDNFMTNLVLFFLKTELGVSSTRFVLRAPNTVLGIVPLGYQDNAVPLANVASVGTDISYRIIRMIFGLFILLSGFGAIGGSAFGGLILILIGLVLLLGSVAATLSVTNNGGAVTKTSVSILEKTKLETFRDEMSQRVFADSGALRHEENLKKKEEELRNQEEQMRNQQTQIQSQIVTNQLLSAQNQQQQPAPPPAAGAPAPAQYQVGDVVNGHRFNGATWEPVDSPPPDPTTEM